MPNAKPPSGFRLWGGVPAALIYLAWIAGVLDILTGISYGWVLAALVALAVCYPAMPLLWLTLWARRRDSRLGQFTVGSLLFSMLFLSVFLSFVGWVASSPGGQLRLQEPGSSEAFLFSAIICIIFFALAIPLLIWATESAVWLAVLAVRSRAVRNWLARRRRRQPR